MHFDDRLGTVLRIRADGEGMRRIQLRQLLDLLGTLPADARGEQVDAAFVRLGELAETIPSADCVKILGEPGLRLRSPRLVAALAAGAPDVARAALGSAQLSDEQWLDLVPALTPAARARLRDRSDLSPTLAVQLNRLGVQSRALPPASTNAAEAPSPSPAALTETPEPAAPQANEPQGISALVKRIEVYRKAREAEQQRPAGDSPRLPLGEDHGGALRRIAAFDFATDPAGQITWSDSSAAPMVTGLRLGAPEGSGALSGPPALGEALRRRQPLRACLVTITGAPAISGAWRIDATPWFDPLTGRHVGWRGRMRRPAAAAPASVPLPRVADTEADRIRQLLHELRTPINAIQGFAEVIQQQLFGPTPHEYRALAANIVGDAARMLSAFDELERLAKLDSAALALEPGETDLAEVFEATIAQLDAHIRQRGAGLVLRRDGASTLTVPLARLEVERVGWRLLATLAGVCGHGEVLKVRLKAKDGAARLDITLPAVLAAREGEALFNTSPTEIQQAIAAGVFGVGFALRLARAEAQAAGGSLERKGDRLRLTLPLAAQAGLTAKAAGHNPDAARAS